MMFFLYSGPHSRVYIIIKSQEFNGHLDELAKAEKEAPHLQRRGTLSRTQEPAENQNITINQNHYYIQQMNVTGRQRLQPENEDDISTQQSMHSQQLLRKESNRNNTALSKLRKG